MVFFFFFVMKGHIWVYRTGISLSIIQSCAYITEEDSLLEIIVFFYPGHTY